MADYYTNFSFIIQLPNPEARKAALELADNVNNYDGEVPHTLPAPLIEVIEDWRFEVEAAGECGLWLHSGDGGLDAVCVFIQHLLQAFDPEGHLGFEWSHDCSKPRTDAYGGGAAFITATSIKTKNTHDWLMEQTARAATTQPLSPIGDT
jgi:hypothetical protein